MNTIHLTDITDEFITEQPNLYRYNFDSDEAYAAYAEKADKVIAEITDKFVAYLERTEAERQMAYLLDIKTYGNTPAPKGRWMWGSINHTYHNGSGIRIISCSGHGGALVSIPQELKIDEELRQGQVYEEDCGIMIVFAYNPRIAVKFNKNYFQDITTARRISAEAVVRYHYKAVRQIVG